MSAASHLRLPITGSAVPDDLGYSAPSRRHKGKRGRKTARATRPQSIAWLGPMLAMGICAAICLVVSVGFVAQKARLMQLGYELSSLQNDLATLEKERAYLQLSLVTARSPKSVEQAAVQRLGMHKPEQVEYLVLEGAEAPVNEVSVATANTQQLSSPVAAVGRWFAGNWPRWGRAEASARL